MLERERLSPRALPKSDAVDDRPMLFLRDKQHSLHRGLVQAERFDEGVRGGEGKGFDLLQRSFDHLAARGFDEKLVEAVVQTDVVVLLDGITQVVDHVVELDHAGVHLRDDSRGCVALGCEACREPLERSADLDGLIDVSFRIGLYREAVRSRPLQ